MNGLLIILELVRMAFKALNLFPTMKHNSSKNVFDPDWLTMLVAKVHSVTGVSPEYAMTQMSISSCCYYFAQFARINGDKSVYRRDDEEILIMEDRRACELIIERLVELKVIPEEERDKWFMEISTPPKK